MNNFNFENEGRTQPPNPFFIPKFNYAVSAIRGAFPLICKFQPLTSGGVGQFYWDFNGDGVWDDITMFQTSCVYDRPGIYFPKAEFHDSAGHVYKADKDTAIKVTTGFNVTQENAKEITPNNSDWSSAQIIHVSDTLKTTCSGYSFFRTHTLQPGLYLIKLSPIEERNPKGLKLTIHTDAGFVVASSGGAGEYGYLAVHLSYGRYFFKVTSDSTTKFAITFKLDDGEEPVIFEQGKVSLSNAVNLSIENPYSDFSNAQFIKIEEGAISTNVKVKFPIFDKPVDVYVAATLISNNKTYFLTLDGLEDTIKPLVTNTDKPFNGEEQTVLSIPKVLSLHGVTFYLAVVPTGIELKDLNKTPYILQFFSL